VRDSHSEAASSPKSGAPVIALSTAYFTARKTEPTGDAIAREARDLGFSSLELDYRLSEVQLRQLLPYVARGEVSARSVHHPLPRRKEVPPAEAHIQRAKFSSFDPDERRAAVRTCAETISRAADLGAEVVVLHVGRVEIGEDLDPQELERLYRAGQKQSHAYKELRGLVDAARRAGISAHRDAALLCLDELCGKALKKGVSLGLENRYHPVEIPDREDLEIIFRELRGAPIGYWHDTGHAASLEALGFLPCQNDLLGAFRERLLGVHLHDARGLDDHLPPGEGALDFKALAAVVAPRARLVLEVHPPATPESVVRARHVLEEAGFPVERGEPGPTPSRGTA